MINKFRRNCDITDWSKITNKFRRNCDVAATTLKISRKLRKKFNREMCRIWYQDKQSRRHNKSTAYFDSTAYSGSVKIGSLESHLHVINRCNLTWGPSKIKWSNPIWTMGGGKIALHFQNSLSLQITILLLTVVLWLLM